MKHTNKHTNRLPVLTLRRLFLGATFAGCLLAAAGCDANKDLHGEDFDSASAPRANGTFIQSQAAASAANEGSLQEQDFSNDVLNSLGQVELDLMVKGTPPTQPVVVHLDFATVVEPDSMTARQASASAYLQDRGVPKTQIQFIEGANTTKSTPAAAVLPFAYSSGGVGAGDVGSAAGSMSAK